MKYTLIIALLLSAIFSVTYANNNNQDPGPMQPGNPKGIVFYLVNSGNHLLDVKSFSATVLFKDGIGTRTDDLWDINIAPWTRENEYEFSKYVPMVSNARKQDSTDMEKGEVYFQLTVKYYDEYQKENRVFSTRVTLKDHHSPQTLTDRVILRDDKKENP